MPTRRRRAAGAWRDRAVMRSEQDDQQDDDEDQDEQSAADVHA
jgi:hypothetical protein